MPCVLFNFLLFALINNAVAKHEKTKESPCSKRLGECTDLHMDCAELCSFCQMHSCSDYCLRTSGKNVKKRTCRMGCGDECPAYSKKTPGWTLSLEDAIIKDKRGFQKLNIQPGILLLYLVFADEILIGPEHLGFSQLLWDILDKCCIASPKPMTQAIEQKSTLYDRDLNLWLEWDAQTCLTRERFVQSPRSRTQRRQRAGGRS